MLRHYNWDAQNRRPIPVNDITKLKFLDAKDRRIGPLFKEHGVVVSTVFLHMDHGFSTDEGSEPVLYETMCFAFGREVRTHRYSDVDDAERGQLLTVRWACDELLSNFRRLRSARRIKQYLQREYGSYSYHLKTLRREGPKAGYELR